MVNHLRCFLKKILLLFLREIIRFLKRQERQLRCTNVKWTGHRVSMLFSLCSESFAPKMCVCALVSRVCTCVSEECSDEEIRFPFSCSDRSKNPLSFRVKREYCMVQIPHYIQTRTLKTFNNSKITWLETYLNNCPATLLLKWCNKSGL